MSIRARFLAEVRKTLGTPYQHRGRIAGVALDCVGVPIVAMAAVGIVVPEPPPYGTMPPSMVEQLLPFFDRVETAEPGDLAAILWHGEPRHCAIVSGHTENGVPIIIHALARIGRVAEHTISRAYRVHSFWRLKEPT